MFSSKRYLTKGVQVEIPLVLQLFLWSCIDRLPEERDYFQVFKLEIVDGLQKITHFSEQPEYQKEYWIPTDFPIDAKVYVIDSEEYATMLLAEEYEPIKALSVSSEGAIFISGGNENGRKNLL